MTDPILERDPVLAEMVQRLVDAFHPERICLFGSKARGDEGPDSDYDLLVVVEHSVEKPYQRAQRAQDVLWGIWSAADVLVMTREEFERRISVPNALPMTVSTEGRILYAA